jgi:hypothetical protein
MSVGQLRARSAQRPAATAGRDPAGRRPSLSEQSADLAFSAGHAQSADPLADCAGTDGLIWAAPALRSKGRQTLFRGDAHELAGRWSDRVAGPVAKSGQRRPGWCRLRRYARARSRSPRTVMALVLGREDQTGAQRRAGIVRRPGRPDPRRGPSRVERALGHHQVGQRAGPRHRDAVQGGQQAGARQADRCAQHVQMAAGQMR